MIYVLIGYMFLFVFRPFEVWPILGILRVERIYMFMAVIVWAWTARKRWISNPLHWAFAAFSGAVLVCWIFSPWAANDLAQHAVEEYFKVLVFYALLVTSVHTEKHLKVIILGFIGIMGVYMTDSLREFLNGRHVFRMGIERMIGVDTTLGDPNAFGMTIVYALPLVITCWRSWTSLRNRGVLAAYLSLSVLCIILTGSRTALIGLLVWMLTIVWNSRQQWRVLVLGAFLIPVVWTSVPEDLKNRFYTLIDPTVGPENAEESAESRTEGFWTGVRLWTADPVTGIGPGAWRSATGMIIESHNLYGQVLGEMGSLGAITFLAIVILFWRNASWIKAAYRDHPEWQRDFLYYLGGALGQALLLLLIMGWAAHSLFRYTWLWYGAFGIIARFCVAKRIHDPNGNNVSERSKIDPLPRQKIVWRHERPQIPSKQADIMN